MHWLTAVAVGRLTQLRSGNPLAAFLAAACFTFLPTHAATVAYVSGRSTGLAAALLMGALLAHEHARARQDSRQYSLLAVVRFLLRVCSKGNRRRLPGLGASPGHSASSTQRRRVFRAWQAVPLARIMQQYEAVNAKMGNLIRVASNPLAPSHTVILSEDKTTRRATCTVQIQRDDRLNRTVLVFWREGGRRS